MSQYRMLGIFAHPDDESRIVGGALARYADQGISVSLLVATRGEAGSCGEPPLCDSEDLAQFRERELREACEILGVSDLSILDYQDGKLEDVDLDELTGHCVAAIRRQRPHVVLTFGPEGRTLHPDHIVIHKAATAAFHIAADPEAYPDDGLPAHAPEKLYYHVVPESITEQASWRFPTQPDREVTLVLDVRPWIAQKQRASNEAHRSQAHDLIFKGITDELRWELLSTEHYVLAATSGRPIPASEHDMFSGIDE
ncbi:MAG: PIG-L family deacetylase [Sphaerobacteraceae bacterium]|nr:MAG: PIG-L family deacetylase [Sphaerobacteraceae bacterium]